MIKYQHYKGGIYTFLTAATHSETHETLAIYQNDEGIAFARPYDMFFEKVEVGGVMVDRFKEIKKVARKPRKNSMNDDLGKWMRGIRGL